MNTNNYFYKKIKGTLDHKIHFSNLAVGTAVLYQAAVTESLSFTLLQQIQEEHQVLALQFTNARGDPSDHCQPASSSRWFRPIHSIVSVAFNCPETEENKQSSTFMLSSCLKIPTGIDLLSWLVTIGIKQNFKSVSRKFRLFFCCP